MQSQETNGFSYTYSAREQAELKRIREKYAPVSDVKNKMERIRRLDASVMQKAQVISLVLGIVGALVLGSGMSLIMTDIGAVIHVEGVLATVLGVCLGIVGGILAGVAYPAYSFVLKKERRRVAPEILRLTDELMK